MQSELKLHLTQKKALWGINSMPTHLLRVSSHNGIVSHCLEEPWVQRRYECLQKTKDHVRVKRTTADLYTGTYGQKTKNICIIYEDLSLFKKSCQRVTYVPIVSCRDCHWLIVWDMWIMYGRLWTKTISDWLIGRGWNMACRQASQSMAEARVCEAQEKQLL